MNDSQFGAEVVDSAVKTFAAQTFAHPTELITTSYFAAVDRLVVHAVSKAVVAAVEVKRRRVPSTKYNDLLVSTHKRHAALALYQYLRVPTYCVTVYADRIGVVALLDEPAEERMVGRADRPTGPIPHVVYSAQQIVWLHGTADVLYSTATVRTA